MADETPTGGEMDGPTRRSLTRAQIRASLHSNVVRKSDKYPHASQKRSDHYICFEAIKDAWKAPKAVHHVLFPAILSPSLEARIRKELLIYLSILVYIQADDFLNNFKRNFLNREGDLVRSDRHLPLVEDDVPDFNVVDNDVLRFSFFQEQYLFSPVVIKESSRPAEVGHLERLPFESETEETLPGAFGTVTKVRISPGYFHSRRDGPLSRPKVVACKRFHHDKSTRDKSHQEISILQVLKASMIRCEGVLLHLAILQHGDDHLILLPWAKHIDLQIFLLEGKDLEGKQVYDFDEEFPVLQNVKFIEGVYTQMAKITEALEWLHKGIKTGGPDEKLVYFAHMDLKPNNILIDDVGDEEPSTVGKWVLTDFGISARKENDEPVSDDFVSIGDVSRRLQSLTINTDPPRGRGSYQPPEVDLWHAGTVNVNNPVPRQGIGRKGDIWSIGCIFAEVIAFSVGRSQEVEKFQDERFNGEDDCFYDRGSSLLKPYPSPEDYVLRGSVLPWLRTLIGREGEPNNLVECAVRTVEEILQPLARDRPTGSELFEKIKHVEKHLWAPQTGTKCPLNRSSTQADSYRGQSVSGGRLTAVRRISAPPKTPIVVQGAASNVAHVSGAASASDGHASSLSPPSGRPGERAHARALNSVNDFEIGRFPQRTGVSSPRQNPSTTHSNNSRYSLKKLADLRAGQMDLASVLPDIRISESSSSDDRRSSRQQSQSQSSSGVYTIDSSIRRQGPLVCGTTKEVIDPTIARITDVSPGRIKTMCLSPRGDFAVTIKPEISTAETQHTIEYFKLSLTASRLDRELSILLPRGAIWSRLSVGGESFVAWSVAPKKEVFFGYYQHTREKMHWEGANYKWLPLLQMAIASSDGIVVFMCRHSIYYASLKETPYEARILFSANTDISETLIHCAFSDDGHVLYAWSSSNRSDRNKCLRAWSSEQFAGRAPAPAVKKYYIGLKAGDSTASIVPYKGDRNYGFVVKLQGDEFFCSTLAEPMTLCSISSVEVNTDITECMHGADSLLVARYGRTVKGFKVSKCINIYERAIKGDTIHCFEENESRNHIQISTNKDGISAMKEFDLGNGNSIIVLFREDGLLIFAPIGSLRK